MIEDIVDKMDLKLEKSRIRKNTGRRKNEKPPWILSFLNDSQKGKEEQILWRE